MSSVTVQSDSTDTGNIDSMNLSGAGSTSEQRNCPGWSKQEILFSVFEYMTAMICRMTEQGDELFEKQFGLFCYFYTAIYFFIFLKNDVVIRCCSRSYERRGWLKGVLHFILM